MTRKAYRLLPHTADLLVSVRASDYPSLCAASVEAVFSLLTDRGRVRRSASRTIASRGENPEERFLSVLRQALLLFSLERFLVRDASATMKGGEVEVTVRGEPMDPARHAIAREIKAVTAHGLSVEESGERFAARFLLDV